MNTIVPDDPALTADFRKHLIWNWVWTWVGVGYLCVAAFLITSDAPYAPADLGKVILLVIAFINTLSLVGRWVGYVQLYTEYRTGMLHACAEAYAAKRSQR